MKSKLRISPITPGSDAINLSAKKAVELLVDGGVITVYWKGNDGVPSEQLNDWVTESEIENHVGLSEQYLRRLRFENDGPPYLKKGNAILYQPAMVRAWIREEKQHATIDLGMD